MTKQVQRRRGTSTQHTSFTGAEGEISVNTTNKSIHVHDGTTAGGVEAARADLANVSDTSLNNALSGNTLASLTITSADINGGTIDGTSIGGTSAGAGTFTTATATTGNITTVNATTVDTTNLEVTTIKAKDGTSAGSIADSTGVVTLASSVLTTTDINGGTVDGAVIGGSSAAAITGTTITATGDVTIADKIIHAGDTNTAIRFPAADTVTVETAGAERLRVDSSGNLGLGVTPSAWNASFKAYQVGNQSLWSASGANGYLSTNGFFNTSGSYIYRSNGFATEYIQSTANGSHSWHTAPSGTAGNAITFTQAMTLDASGRLGVGTTSMDQRLVLSNAGEVFAKFNNSSANYNSYFGSNATGTYIGNDITLPIVFYTNGTERARIDSSGNLLVGTTALGGSSSNAALIIVGGIRTAAGLLSSIASGTATTAFSITAANRGRYEVVAMIANSGDASTYSAISTVIWDGTTGRAVSNNGTLFTITLSGSNVQVTQISGSAQDVYWSFQRIAL
jgi:hypothetical protein